MLLKRFYDTQLAQASYLVGCQATGDAIIIDPNRDTAQYLAALKAEQMRLRYVTETHIHADYLSGTRELAKASGARPVLSDEGGEGWRYGWAREAGAELVKDGAVLMVGNIKVEILHTPGHTPEHICFRITDTPATDRPMGVFTGDFIFVGDVGRPDLLERAAGVKGTMDAAARQLYASIQRFKSNPDYLQVWPGHGAGSACGKSLGAVPSSTLGYERIANWAFNARTEDEFVREVLTGQPEPPAYFAVMKRLNRDGPPAKPAARPPRVPGSSLPEKIAAGDLVADTRKTVEFAAHHVRGSLNVPLGGSFATYAGQVLSHGKLIVLVVPETSLDTALAGLASIGLDQVTGWLPPDELGSAAAETTPQVKPEEAAQKVRDGEAVVVDVRARSEWDEGHIPGAVHVPLSTLQQHVAEVPKGTPVILQCGGGGRSAVAASVLRSHGIHDVMNLTGGIERWRKEGLPIENGVLGAG